MLAELYEHWYNKIEKLNFSNNIEREAWEHTLASYNAGIGRVRYYGGIFNNEGVSNYIALLLRILNKNKMWYSYCNILFKKYHIMKNFLYLVILIFVTSCTSTSYVYDDVYYTPKR